MLIENAVVLASVTFIGGYMVWQKLPRRVRKWLQKQSLLTDLGLLYLGYLVLGGTATALLASAILGLMVSMALYVANHPDDFAWLSDIIDELKATPGAVTVNSSSTDLVPVS